ncbi:MAG: ABC transporter ATP-binding protein [Egibacteraceae bacterium]
MIEVQGLSKRFVVRVKRGRLRRERRVVEAVRDVSFTIPPGAMVGYLGPNGAGKSTTIKMLTGILVPSAGHVRVLGMDPAAQRRQLARRIGAMFGQRVQLWWDLPLVESFELLRHVYRVPASRYADNLAAFRDLLDLDSFLDTPVRQLSLGQRVRGELVAVLLHDPEIVFLDEPTIGLDVVAKFRVREFLTRMNRERGLTVLLTTHDLSDIERVCQRLLIIDHGQVIEDGAVDQLVARYGGERTMVVDLEEPAEPLRVAGAHVARVEGPRQWLRFDRTEVTAAQVAAAVAAQARLVDLAIEEPDIEDVIRRIYAGSTERRAAGGP